MFLTLLMPPKIKTHCAQKFYDLLVEELNDLFYKGIADGKLKGALVMSRADQKGKEFDLGLRACTSYDAPCCVCEILALRTCRPFTKINVGEYRRFLPPNHPYRRDPTFGPCELRDAPHCRTAARCHVGVQIVQDEDFDLQHYQGYVHYPIFHGLRYYNPFVQSAADLSHNMANFCTVSDIATQNYLLSVLILPLSLTLTPLTPIQMSHQSTFQLLRPSESMISKWRKEACSSGRFVEISSETEQFLDADVANLLRGLEVGEYVTVANL